MRERPGPESLSTTSADGKRIPVFPAEVRGPWNLRRIWVQWILIAIYVGIPWIQIDGHPLVLLDVEHRRFSLFGKLFFAQETPNLVFLALSFVFLMGLVTSWFGRVWCGWSCPQTVFIERIFRAIERKIEGNAFEQRRQHQGPWGFEKTVKKAIKWAVFTAVAILLSHSFLAYFVGQGESFRMMTRSPWEHPGSFLVVAVFTGIVLFDFGWFREQFCLVACPYGRFQSVMMDDASLFVHYDKRRPDCVDCFKCVAVCPTGIDIRNGLQMECIACTACIDACDSVMEKLRKPKGLISYQSLRQLAGRKFRWFRGRPLIYLGGLCLCVLVLGLRLSRRAPYSVEITRAVDTPYQWLRGAGDQEFLLNHFKVHLGNLGWDTLYPEVSLSAKDLEEQVEWVIPPGRPVGRGQAIESGEHQEFDLFLKVPKPRYLDPSRAKSIPLLIRWDGSRMSEAAMKLIGPIHDL